MKTNGNKCVPKFVYVKKFALFLNERIRFADDYVDQKKANCISKLIWSFELCRNYWGCYPLQINLREANRQVTSPKEIMRLLVLESGLGLPEPT